MKVVSDYKIEIDTIIGTKLSLTATLIILEEAAQLVVCDQRGQLSNMVCTMNIYPEEPHKISSTKVFDESSNQQQEEDGIVTDKAIKIAEKICQKIGLKQLLFSFNVSQNLCELMNQDMKLSLMLEKRLSDLIKEQQQNS